MLLLLFLIVCCSSYPAHFLFSRVWECSSPCPSWRSLWRVAVPRSTWRRPDSHSGSTVDMVSSRNKLGKLFCSLFNRLISLYIYYDQCAKNNLICSPHPASVVYAGCKCCLHDIGKLSFELAIIRARGRLFRNAPTGARDSFPNATTRARDSFSQCSKSSLRLAFECSNSNTNDRQFEVCVFGWFFFTIIITFCHSMPFMSMYQLN